MIKFFQNLELLEEELLIRNESVHFIYFFKMEEYENIASVRFQDIEDYDIKIIGGLVGTFHSFSGLRKLDTINSIQLNYLRLLFAISENYITVFAVDPDQPDEYYFKVIRILLECLEFSEQRPNNMNTEDNFDKLTVSIEMVFSLIYQNRAIDTIYPERDKNMIQESTKAELNEILKEIYESHEKFFKKVIT